MCIMFILLDLCLGYFNTGLFLCCVTNCFSLLHSFSARALRWMQTMTFAIKEINQRSDLLPQLKLGFHIRDSCDDIPVSLTASLLLVNGQPERGSRAESGKKDKGPKSNLGSNLGCAAVQRSVSPVIIGDAASGVSMALLRSLGSFHIPLVRLPDGLCTFVMIILIIYVFLPC